MRCEKGDGNLENDCTGMTLSVWEQKAPEDQVEVIWNKKLPAEGEGITRKVGE